MAKAKTIEEAKKGLAKMGITVTKSGWGYKISAIPGDHTEAEVIAHYNYKIR